MSLIRRYLRDMLREIEDIESFASGGQELFFHDRKTQKAMIRSYEVIGEIVKRIPADILDAQPAVEWQKLKGFRDFLIHNYDKVTLRLVWEAVEKLPALKKAVESMLASLPED